MTAAAPPLSVADALAKVLASAPEPLGREIAALAAAAGRTLAEPLKAKRTQPPFAASAMDGYAVRVGDLARVPATLRLVGTSAAGHGYTGSLGPGETVRIFTGAPLPDGADAVVIQEDVEADGNVIAFREPASHGRHVRPAGL